MPSCVDLDGLTNGFTLALGTGPRGHKGARAYSETGCPPNADMGGMPPTNNKNPEQGSCVDANTYMMAEPNFYGFRINSVRFM